MEINYYVIKLISVPLRNGRCRIKKPHTANTVSYTSARDEELHREKEFEHKYAQLASMHPEEAPPTKTSVKKLPLWERLFTVPVSKNKDDERTTDAASKKRKFTLFEEFEVELRTADEQAAEAIINQDQYYNIPLTDDEGENSKARNSILNIKVFSILISIILIIVILVISVSYFIS